MKAEEIGFSFPLRPQEPFPPYPYLEERVVYDNTTAKVTLAGTLTLPRTTPSPAVLLIAGAGPLDRNETACGHKPFLVLADSLTRRGIAVLRSDKRGVARSSGNYHNSTTEDFASDVLAGVNYLKSRSEIQSGRIGLIGHSEGSVVASIATAKSRDVAFMVLMAGPGVNGEEIIHEQLGLTFRSMGFNEEEIEKERTLHKQMFSVVKREANFDLAEKKLHHVAAKYLARVPLEYRGATQEKLEAKIKWFNSKWYRYFLTNEPTASLKQNRAPTLVLNGELDLQVSPKQNLPVIAKALEEAGNKDYSVIEFPKVNHLFQTCKSGSLAEYSEIEETLCPAVINVMANWILQRVDLRCG